MQRRDRVIDRGRLDGRSHVAIEIELERIEIGAGRRHREQAQGVGTERRIGRNAARGAEMHRTPGRLRDARVERESAIERLAARVAGAGENVLQRTDLPGRQALAGARTAPTRDRSRNVRSR